MGARKIGVLGCLLAMTLEPCLFGQSTARASVPCGFGHWVIAPRNPARGRNGVILPGQAITQARLGLGRNAAVRVVEHPRPGKALDAYNSVIVVRERQAEEAYPLSELVKGGQFFRLIEAARVCSSPNTGTVFLAFGAGSTGASQAFVAVRLSRREVKVQALPLASAGRIVIRSPTELDLWTAVGGAGLGGIECDACKERYAVSSCQLGEKQVLCSKAARAAGPISPDRFMRARIEVRWHRRKP